MNYSELIIKKKQYRYSANICFDLKNDEKLADFIPNVTTTEILAEYLHSIIEENNDVHSRILYGSYGTGKSHLLTVLCSILGHINVNGKGFDTFNQAINRYDPELAKFIKKYISEGKPYLVVPVYSDFSEFDKCISYSLKKELNKNNICICFKSYFDEAIALLENWKKGQESSVRLLEVCESTGVVLNELQDSLEKLEVSSEKKFNEIFKGMTYGATFVSETGNLIDNIDLANEAIKKDYKGIVFVFDEFGRYLEDVGENIKVKSVQNLAEYCDHSQYNNYLILVSHKQLSLYTDKMKTELTEEWKKVEGRFKATYINSRSDQCLTLIPHIIPKSEKWDKFKAKYEVELSNLYQQAFDFKGFLVLPEEGNPFEGGYPLHPITLYALDKLSKKVAQNERTFFTYLASEEENSLFAQLKEMDDDEFHFIGLDAIYDYFETNVRSYRSNEVYAIYRKLQNALNKIVDIEQSEIETRLLKALAVIGIISDTTVLKSDKKTLLNVIDSKDEIVSEAIKKLVRLKIIRYMRQYEYYDFLDGSIYDLDSMIEEKIDSINDDMVAITLNQEFSDFVIFPYAYNSAYHMNRIFVPIFVQKHDINKKGVTKALPKYYDGVVAFVLDSEFNETEYPRSEYITKRMIMLVNQDTEVVQREVKRFIAIKYFYTKKEELKQYDPTVEKELEIYLEEQRGIISEIVYQWRTLGTKHIIPYMNAKKLNIDSEVELSDVASDLMFRTFTDTIIVNNDLINKNIVTRAIDIARNKALTYIIEDDDIIKSCALRSPEHTIIRSVLSKNDILSDKNVKKLNRLPNGKIAGVPVQRVIKKFLNKCMEAQVSFSVIYDKLKQPPFGLRDGYIPILLAYELREFDNISLYFHGSEKDYNAEELIKALDSPDDYTLHICNWNENQKEYIKSLENIFCRFLSTQTKNRLKGLYVALNLHFASIPKGARTTEKFVSSITKQYRDIMNVSHNDYNQFFFKILPQINNDLHELIVQIKNIKKELENVVALQIECVNKVIRNVFNIKERESIVKWVNNKYKEDWSAKKHKVFDYYTNAFLEYIQDMDLYEQDTTFISDIAKLVTGFEIEYWNDSKIDEFDNELMRIAQQLEDYHVQEVVSDNEMKIIIQSGSDEVKVTQFNKQELNTNGQVLFNKLKSALNDFGEAVSYEEKMQVISRLFVEIN